MVAKTVERISQVIADELMAESSIATPAAHLYVGVDVAKNAHVAAFVSSDLISKHGRYEKCPPLVFANSREGFEKLAA